MRTSLRLLFVCLLFISGAAFAQKGDLSDVGPYNKDIVGGSNANISDYPYQVSVQTTSGFHFCGGSVLNENFILSANHCFVGTNPSSIRVMAGASNLSQSSSGQIRTVVEIIRYPGYTSTVNGKDVCLLRLGSPLDLSDPNVSAIGIVTQADAAAGLDDVGVLSTITGWGTLSSGGSSPDRLQVAQVPIISNAQAQADYPQYTITADQLGAAYPQGGIDACQGDSGGPLVVPDGQGGFKQAGITSWGIGCADAGNPGMYARVSEFDTWIIANSTSGGSTGYCASQGNNVSDEFIQRVQFNTIDNNSGSNGGYADFTSISTSVTKGTAYTITVTPTWTGTVYNEGYSVWIDYDQDEVFEAGEQVFTSGPNTSTSVSGSITIPTSAADGDTRMRVSMKYNAIPTACETFTYGEVEDYTITIGTSGGGGCNTPSGLAASAVTLDGFTLNWSAVSGAADYTVRVRTGGGTWQEFTSTTTSLSLSGGASGTQYETQVRANCGSSSSNYSSSVFVTTLSPVTYCSAQGNNTSDEYLNRVRFNTIDNTSGDNGGYGDFTGQSTTVNAGSSYTITLNPAWTGTVYREGYAAWIDFNQDGDFNDAGEQVYSRNRTTATQVSGTVTIPTTALAGPTRMRVIMRYNTTPSSCGSFTYGEVEDYTVNISQGNSLARDFSSPVGADFEFSMYPNPAVNGSTTLNFSTNGTTADVLLNIVDMTGRTVLTHDWKQVNGNIAYPLDVTAFEKGIYLINMRSNGVNHVEKLILKQIFKQYL